MTTDSTAILLLQDVQELRELMKGALEKRGYRVLAAGDERDAVEKARLHAVGLILINVGPSSSESAEPSEAASVARRIREASGSGENVPVVILSSKSVAEGEELSVGDRVHVIHPNRHEQLEEMVARLLPPPVPEE